MDFQTKTDNYFNFPIVFTNTDWINTMTHPQHNCCFNGWDEDNRINYHVPPTAFKIPVMQLETIQFHQEMKKYFSKSITN